MGTRFTRLAVAAIAAMAVAGCSPSPAAPAATRPAPAATTPPASPVTARTAEQIATAMGVTGFTAYNASTDPNQLLGRQGEYTSKVNWGTDLSNSIEVFASIKDAEARYEYVKGFRCPFGDGYDFLTGTALLRMACSLTPPQAKVMEEKFAAAGG